MACMKKRKRYGESVRINQDLMNRIRTISSVTGAMVSWVVNKALSEWLTSREDELLGRKK